MIVVGIMVVLVVSIDECSRRRRREEEERGDNVGSRVGGRATLGRSV